MTTPATLKELKETAHHHLTEKGLNVSYNFVHKIMKKWITHNPGATQQDVRDFLDEKQDLFTGIMYADKTGNTATRNAARHAASQFLKAA